MSTIEDALAANNLYATSFKLGSLPMPPARRIAVVACMDARLTIEPMLGLRTGDAHIIRNAGGIVTDDVIRSVIISQQLLGTQEVMIINHTDCGMLTFDGEQLRAKLASKTGKLAASPTRFHAFKNLEKNVEEQIEKLRSHPWIPQNITIRGFVYDVRSGKLNEIISAIERRAA